MSTLELKKEIHSLVDKIEAEDQLVMLHDVLTTMHSHGDLWDTLTDAQQKELEEAIEESKNPNNLIPHKQVMKEANEWLSKSSGLRKRG